MKREGDVLVFEASEAGEEVRFRKGMYQDLGAEKVADIIIKHLAQFGHERADVWRRVGAMAREQGILHDGEHLVYNWATLQFSASGAPQGKVEVRPGRSRFRGSVAGRREWLRREKLLAVEEKRFEDAAWLGDYEVRLGEAQRFAAVKKEGEQPSVAAEPEIITEEDPA